MATVGVKELKLRASEILNSIRENKTEIVVAYSGTPALSIIPLEKN